MGKEDEVIPDSQDEAELQPLDSASDRELSPAAEQPTLTNATTPSLRTSPSYVLPRPVPIKHTAPSTISQFTMETVVSTEPINTSTVSAFHSSSSFSSDTTKKSRPKPRPAYMVANASKDTSASIILGVDASVTSPPVPIPARVPYTLPSPRATFSTDISERIKARRATTASASASPLVQEKQGNDPSKSKKVVPKKRMPAVETVIDINSDDDPLPRPSRRSLLSHRHKETGDPLQSPDPLNLSAATRVSPTGPLRRDPEDGDHDTSPVPSRKRKRQLAILPADFDSNHSHTATAGPDASDIPAPANDKESAPLPKKKSKTVANTEDGGREKPQKKKVKEKGKEPKKPRAKPQTKEKEQFKSSEFIIDSDGDPGLAAADDTNGSRMAVTAAASAPTAMVVGSASTFESSKASVHDQAATRLEAEPAGKAHAKPEQPVLQPSGKKTASKKRKTAEAHDEGLPVDAAEPKSKKAKRSEEGADRSTAKKKRTKTDVEKFSVTEGAHKANDSPEKTPNTPNAEPVVKTKRKKGGRTIVDDESEEEDEGSKENAIPSPPQTSTPKILDAVPSPPSKALPTSMPKLSFTPKPSYAHPPKNRALSDILYRVNGSSPRPRASPSVSRNLLSRIAPLHPNRRTPPPPPPPRIVPKKTKKEIDREEKWEEELQETVEGWCELEEGERERMRRAKRDWELGLCEE